MATITGNPVTRVGATPVTGQNGIFVKGASATVSGNTVAGNECDDVAGGCGPDPLDFQAAGIVLLGAAAGSTVTDNSVAANDLGIYNRAEGATTISGNTVTGNRFLWHRTGPRRCHGRLQHDRP